MYQSDFFDTARFSDAFNGILFNGRQMMKPEELEEAETELVSFLEKGTGQKVIRDKVRKWRGKYFAIMVLENQSYVDYSMVLRVMKAEAMGYEKQQKEAWKAGQKQTVADSHEYLSKMRRIQKFTPIITLILYLGTERPWDGARSLHEILEIDKELKPFVNDYHIHVYDFHEHNDFSIFQTENRILFEVLSCADDWQKMRLIMEGKPELYDNLDEESIRAIIGILGRKVDLDRIRITERNQRRGGFSMCKALEECKEEGRVEGRIEGRTESRAEALNNLMKNLKVTLEEAMSLLGIPEEERSNYLSLK